MSKSFFKQGLVAILISYAFVSCSNDSENTREGEGKIEEKVEIVDVYQFGIKTNDYTVIDRKVERGETFGEILLKQNIEYSTIHNLVKLSKGVFNIKHFQRNRNYTLLCKKDSLSTAEVMIYQKNKIEYIVFDMRDSLNVYSGKKEVVLREREVSGLISSSLSEALSSQDIDNRVSVEMSDIYAWTVDFFRLQKGDYFKLIFDEKYIDDSVYVGIGPIKASLFYNNGESFYSFYFDKGKTPEFFDESGQNLKKAFLKAPLKFGTFRISSRYSGRRFHPVQHRWKSHLGTDYAAPTGTPIYSTSAGTVVASTYNKNNGHYVKIRHNSTYTTQYLHMSRRATRVGKKVRQGQLIGYVGMTGLATGPHVCYRFWKNGVQVDALRQKVPNAKSVSKDLKLEYLEFIKPLKERIDNIALPVKFDAKEVRDEDVIESAE